MTQAGALKILKTGANVFLTGEPGAGKTYTLREYIKYLKSHGIEPAITASTGIAATHINGTTIHSWSGIGIKDNITKYDIENIVNKKHIYNKILKTKVLIIDEISMIPAGMLDAISAICQEIKRNSEPWGGMQVVLVGDFFQLPPVRDAYNSGYAFNAKAFKNSNIVVCYLTEQHRQIDDPLLNILAAIRSSEVEQEHFEDLSSRFIENIDKRDLITNDSKKTMLYTHNASVDELNNKELKKLSGKSYTYKMTSKGKEKYVDQLVRGCLSPEVLDLKIGTRVMCTKNNPARNFVNGTLGEVIGFGEYNNYPIIKTEDDTEILIEPMNWQVEEDGKILAEVTQVPLRHAWAITVHKSQGVSLDSAVIDLSRTFTHGQGYVALSRVRTLKGITLLGINNMALSVDENILEKDKEFKKLSREAGNVFGRLPDDDLFAMHKNFIISMGGNLEENKPKAKKENTHDVTLKLVKEEKSLDEIVFERGLKLDTIVDHIHVLLERNEITLDEVLKLVPRELSKKLKDIYKAFDEDGTNSLKPVYEKLKGHVPYADLKLARIVYQKLFD